MLVCHTGDRRTKTGELYKPEFARGEPVVEFNQGRPLVHHFKLAGEKYELDLEKLATKETAILERYTNPGGVTLSIRIEFITCGKKQVIFGDRVEIMGSTRRKRVKTEDASQFATMLPQQRPTKKRVVKSERPIDQVLLAFKHRKFLELVGPNGVKSSPASKPMTIVKTDEATTRRHDRLDNSDDTIPLSSKMDYSIPGYSILEHSIHQDLEATFPDLYTKLSDDDFPSTPNHSQSIEDMIEDISDLACDTCTPDDPIGYAMNLPCPMSGVHAVANVHAFFGEHTRSSTPCGYQEKITLGIEI